MRFFLPRDLEDESVKTERRLSFVVRAITQLFIGLNKLSFKDNFDSFEATVKFDADEKAIPNGFRDGSAPKDVMRAGDGWAIVSLGDTAPTTKLVYVKNLFGTTNETVTVRFLK